MKRQLRTIAVGAAGAIMLLGSTTALAHEDHLGTWDPSPESSSPNLKIIGSTPKTSTTASYRNSDLAFWGKLAFAGNYEGFRVIDGSDPENPEVLADVACPGSQHDVSVWKGLLFLSVDSPRTGPGCDSVSQPARTPGFEGIRIFDVSDPASPTYKGAVATDCGSHTHTLVPDRADPSRVLLYVASYPTTPLEESAFGNSCAQLNPDGTQGHSKISVVEVPLANPAAASVVSEPVFELNDRGSTPGFRGCHDISVFTGIDRAAGACMSEGQIWDISEPEHPTTVARIHNPDVEFFHSATFTHDGRTVLFGDENGGGVAPRCREQDASTVGAIWIYDMGQLDTMDSSTQDAPLSHFKIPRVQGDKARCTMHNFNVLPLEDRYVGVSSAYSGGTTVFDFTDTANPVEVGHQDPHGANTWSSYWYNGHIYTSDTGRGVDVMVLTDPARAGAKRLAHLNPQTQEQVID